MNKSEKLAAQIRALKVELNEVKAAEFIEAREAARHAINRAVKASGLLAVVSVGGLSSGALVTEFRQAAERLKATAQTVETHSATQRIAPLSEDKYGWHGAHE